MQLFTICCDCHIQWHILDTNAIENHVHHTAAFGINRTKISISCFCMSTISFNSIPADCSEGKSCGSMTISLGISFCAFEIMLQSDFSWSNAGTKAKYTSPNLISFWNKRIEPSSFETNWMVVWILWTLSTSCWSTAFTATLLEQHFFNFWWRDKFPAEICSPHFSHFFFIFWWESVCRLKTSVLPVTTHRTNMNHFCEPTYVACLLRIKTLNCHSILQHNIVWIDITSGCGCGCGSVCGADSKIAMNWMRWIRMFWIWFDLQSMATQRNRTNCCT